MNTDGHTYVAIDLKSFYASVECVDRGLDPLTTNLVVADASRTEKTICLAVSPSLKSYGLKGRARLFEVVQRVREVNWQRAQACGGRFSGKSFHQPALQQSPQLELDYIVAPPRMSHYMEVSAQVYATYLKYIAPEDIHVYSIDEVFMDVTPYLRSYGKTAHELAMTMIRDVLSRTGITATAGIGTNLYLAKIAMDIVAKHIPADKDGVRIAELDEHSYREKLWDHRPLTDFWRLGRGYQQKLAPYGIDTMGKIARLSLRNEGLLYQLFGINAELLIDHAWGWEPCTMSAIKAYKPETNSTSSGQVLQEPYSWAKARVVVQEMADSVALDLVAHHKVTDRLVLTVGYDRESLTRPDIHYEGPVTQDYYGRMVPRHAHGTANLGGHTASAKRISEAVLKVYDEAVDRRLLIRRLNVTACHIISEEKAQAEKKPLQLDLFDDNEAMLQKLNTDREQQARERRMQEARLAIRRRFGNNAILRGLNFEEGATQKERNAQIGGHRA